MFSFSQSHYSHLSDGSIYARQGQELQCYPRFSLSLQFRYPDHSDCSLIFQQICLRLAPFCQYLLTIQQESYCLRYLNDLWEYTAIEENLRHHQPNLFGNLEMGLSQNQKTWIRILPRNLHIKSSYQLEAYLLWVLSNMLDRCKFCFSAGSIALYSVLSSLEMSFEIKKYYLLNI